MALSRESTVIKYQHLWPTRDYGWYSSIRMPQIYPAADALSYSFLTSDTGAGAGSDSSSFSSIVADVMVSVQGDSGSSSFGTSGLEGNVGSEVLSLSSLFADIVVEVFGEAASGSVPGISLGPDANAVSGSVAAGVLIPLLSGDADSSSSFGSAGGAETGIDTISASSAGAEAVVIVAADGVSTSSGASDSDVSSESGVSSSGVISAVVAALVDGAADSGSSVSEVVTSEIGPPVVEVAADASSRAESTSGFTFTASSETSVSVNAISRAESLSLFGFTSSTVVQVVSMVASAQANSTMWMYPKVAVEGNAAPIVYPPPGTSVLVFNSANGATAAMPTMPVGRPLQAGDLILVWAVVQTVTGTNPPYATVPAAGGTVPAFVTKPAWQGTGAYNPAQVANKVGRSVQFAYAYATAATNTVGTWTGATSVTVGVVDNPREAANGGPIGAFDERNIASFGPFAQLFDFPNLTLERPDNTSLLLRTAIAGVGTGSATMSPILDSAGTQIDNLTTRAHRYTRPKTDAPATLGSGSVEIRKHKTAFIPNAFSFSYSPEVHARGVSVEVCGKSPAANEQEILLNVPVVNRDIAVPDWVQSIDMAVLGGGGGGQSGAGAFLNGQGGFGAIWGYPQRSGDPQGAGRSINVSDLKASAVTQFAAQGLTNVNLIKSLFIRCTVGAGGDGGRIVSLIAGTAPTQGGQSTAWVFVTHNDGRTFGPVTGGQYRSSGGLTLAGLTVKFGQAVTGGINNQITVNFNGRIWSGARISEVAGDAPGGGGAGGAGALLAGFDGFDGGAGCVNLRFNQILAVV